jgi:putative methyltransferase (TIGR04325 family)
MDLADRLNALAARLASGGAAQARRLEAARQHFLNNRRENLFFGVYETWEEAERVAKGYGAVGYDQSSTVQMYEARVRKDQHDFPSVYWIQRSALEGLRSVFDVGGNIGIKYLAFRDALAPWPDLTWKVQDVTAVVEHGRRLSAERGDSATLSFTDRFDDGEGCDLLFASGVLQYLPETLGEMLARWKQRPRRLVINTAAIHPEASFFTVNSIGTAFCPYRVQTQASLVRGLAPLGYRVRENWVNPDKPLQIPGRPDRSLSAYSGFCMDRTD